MNALRRNEKTFSFGQFHFNQTIELKTTSSYSTAHMFSLRRTESLSIRKVKCLDFQQYSVVLIEPLYQFMFNEQQTTAANSSQQQ